MVGAGDGKQPRRRFVRAVPGVRRAPAVRRGGDRGARDDHADLTDAVGREERKPGTG
jgi:hypothetical protein